MRRRLFCVDEISGAVLVLIYVVDELTIYSIHSPTYVGLACLPTWIEL